MAFRRSSTHTPRALFVQLISRLMHFFFAVSVVPAERLPQDMKWAHITFGDVPSDGVHTSSHRLSAAAAAAGSSFSHRRESLCPCLAKYSESLSESITSALQSAHPAHLNHPVSASGFPYLISIIIATVQQPLCHRSEQ